MSDIDDKISSLWPQSVAPNVVYINFDGEGTELLKTEPWVRVLNMN